MSGMPRLPQTFARLPELVSRTSLWGRSHHDHTRLITTQAGKMTSETRGQQTPVMSRSEGSSKCPPAPLSLPAISLRPSTRRNPALITAIERSGGTAGRRDGAGMKYGIGMGSPELYQYLVEHSYRPSKHLDALHNVSQWCHLRL